MTAAALPFEIASDHDLSGLTPAQRAQFDAAASFHALVNPGAVIDVRVAIGQIHEFPRFTDSSTLVEHAGWATIASVRITSTATGTLREPSAAPLTRYVRLAHEGATPATVEPKLSPSLPRRAYTMLERTAPRLTEALREAITRFRARELRTPMPRYPANAGGAEVAAVTARMAVPALPPAGSPRAVLIGMHWLQTGGAERWAVESIALAKAAGFLPIVVTDQNSVHPWITRPELQGCVVILQSSRGHESGFDLRLTRAILENYDLRGVVIHHSNWLYRSLPYLRANRPDLPVIDSLHIIEYLHGGYAGWATQYTDFVSTHHFISPQLMNWLGKTQKVPAEKLALAPLTALTVDESREFRERPPGASPFTISFIGRFSRQKRPDLFLLLVHALRKQGLPIRAIMQGSGERQYLVDALMNRFKLASVVEMRGEETPVSETLAETDLLVIASMNEGLTLTTFEAIAAGVPVFSSDVGSQYSIVEGDMLAPRPGLPFVRKAKRTIGALIRERDSGEARRRLAWEAQRDRVREFNEHIDAYHYFERLFAQWQA